MTKGNSKKNTTFSRQSINYQVVVFQLLLVLFEVVVLFYLYVYFSNQLETQNSEYTSDAISSKAYILNDKFEDYADVMLHMSFNKDVQSFLKSENLQSLHKSILRLEDYLTMLALIENDIEKVILLEGMRDYNIYYDDRDIQIYDMAETIELSSKAQYLGILEGHNSNNILLGNTVYDLEDSMVPVGKLIFVIKEDVIMGEMAADYGDYFMVTDTGQVVFGADETMTGQTINDDSIDITREDWHLEDMNLKLIGVDTMNRLDENARQVWMIFTLLTVSFLGVVIFTYGFISRNVIKYLKRIHSFISVIGEGDLRKLKSRLDVQGPLEVREISHEINVLLDEVRALTNRLVVSTGNLYKAEISQKEAELNYLKNQINPHFLYNTLAVVKSIAVSYGADEIDQITSALVRIFRYSIKGDKFVALRQELDIVKAYVNIQSIRFEKRFDVVYDIEEHLYDVKIQKMILQPLLENAIQHGIEPTYSHSSIIIRACETEAYIEISVHDNGVGMAPEKVSRLNEMLHNDNDSITEEKSHIGLFNVHRRLAHYYGKGSGLTITSEAGQGTTVTIRIASEFIDE